MLHNKNLKNIFIFLSILLLAGALRMYGLDKYSLWYDEAISPLQEGGMIKLPSIVKLFNGNFAVKNPDYLAMYNYSFICYWQEMFGQSEFALRMSSVMLSLLAICLLYLLAKTLFDIKTARIAAFLLAVSPFHIYYSQELRPYAAVGFFTLLCVYSLLQILNGNSKIRWWFVYGLSSVANVYFLSVNLFFLLSFSLFFICKINKISIKRFIITHLAILVFLIPALLIIYHNLVFVFTYKIPVDTNEFPTWSDGEVGIKNLIFMIKNFSIGYHVDYHSLIGKSSTFIYSFIFCSSVIRFWKKEKMHFLLLCLLVPLAAMFFVSQIKDCYVYRYSFTVLPLFFLVVAAGLGSMNKALSFSFLAAISFLTIFGLAAFHSNSLPADISQYTGVREKQDIREAMKTVVANYVEGDNILQICRSTVFPLKFYARKFHAGSSLLAEVDRGSVVRLSDDGKFLLCDYSSMHPFTFLREDYRSVGDFKDSKRICLIFSNWRFRDLGEKEYGVLSRLRKDFEEVKVEKFPDIELYYFKKK